MNPNDSQPVQQTNVAPVTTSPDDAQPASIAEDDWSHAIKDYVTDKGQEVTIPEEGKPIETKKTTTDDNSMGDTGEVKTEAVADDNTQSTQPKSDVREARQIQREIAEDREATMADIRKELFTSTPEQLEDADGDPIRTIEDVQQLLNPRTGQNFTEEEAGAWLLAATQHQAKQHEDDTREVERITDVNLSIKDDADAIREKYGEILKANPDNIREKLAEAFQKTLTLKNGIIVETPVSLASLYEVALAPYASVANQLAVVEEARSKAVKAQTEAEKMQARSDRQDIYSGGDSSIQDVEAEGWAKAAKQYYES